MAAVVVVVVVKDTNHDDIMVSAKEVDEGVDELPEDLPEPKPSLAEADQSERGAWRLRFLRKCLRLVDLKRR